MVAVFWLLRNKAPQQVDKWFRIPAAAVVAGSTFCLIRFFVRQA